MGILQALGFIIKKMIFPPDLLKNLHRGFRHTLSDHICFQPSTPPRQNAKQIRKPSELQMDYDDVWITTKDNVKIYSFLIKKDSYPTIIMFHGNAGSIGDRLDYVKLLHQNLCVNMLLVEYRGYGPSKGIPTEKGLYRDAEAAFDYIFHHPKLDPSKIFIMGQSIGGAVAINLCSDKYYENKIAGLIVENTFTSIPEVTKQKCACTKFLPPCAHVNKFDNLSKVSNIRCPTLFITSLNDEVVPPRMMAKLIVQCGSDLVDVHTLDAKHNDACHCDEYTEIIFRFIHSVAEGNLEFMTMHKKHELKNKLIESPKDSNGNSKQPHDEFQVGEANRIKLDYLFYVSKLRKEKFTY